MAYCRNRGAQRAPREELRSNGNVWITHNRAKTMKQDNGAFGLLVGGIVALAAMFFIFGGGELGGKTVINGDEDLPPIASAARN